MAQRTSLQQNQWSVKLVDSSSSYALLEAQLAAYEDLSNGHIMKAQLATFLNYSTQTHYELHVMIPILPSLLDFVRSKKDDVAVMQLPKLFVLNRLVFDPRGNVQFLFVTLQFKALYKFPTLRTRLISSRVDYNNHFLNFHFQLLSILIPKISQTHPISSTIFSY